MDKFYSLSFLLVLFLSSPGGEGAIGINYGVEGDNLPSPAHSESKLRQINIKKVRILEPNKDVLTALHKSGKSVIVGAPNDEVKSLSTEPFAAAKWVKTHILPHRSLVNFTCISVGDRVSSSRLGQYIPKAMNNIYSALLAANLSIPVSTSVSMDVLSTSYPPSSGVFSRYSMPYITKIVNFLASKKFPLLVSVQPYFARLEEPDHIDLKYALGKVGSTVTRDGPRTYLNIFDAMIDAVRAALSKIGRTDVEIVVSETGWPTHGGPEASVKNAETYVNNLIGRVSSGKGTPMRPEKEIEAYISALFNENLRPRGVGRYWGLYNPNLTEAYRIRLWKAGHSSKGHKSPRGKMGINCGLVGDNLPDPSRTISRLRQIKVELIRIFQPDQNVLKALHNSGISVIVGVYNPDLTSLATDTSAAAAWVKTNILPHHSFVNITCIAAGNEVYPDQQLAQYLPNAMRNLQAALVAAKLSIPVSTAVSMQVLSTSYPPSSGAFAQQAIPIMTQISQFLASNNYPLLLNVYPYFARLGDPTDVPLDYALFKDSTPVTRDGPFSYLNLFDAMLDAAYAALEKVGASGVEIIVSETGWPTEGGADASIDNAKIYVNNLIAHVSSGKGTPRRPGKEIKTYIFAMYNEDLKPAGIERHWGLHYPNLTEVYHVDHF